MKKNLSIMLITLLLIMFAGIGICQAVGPDLGSGSYSGVDIDSEEPTSDIDADDQGVTGSTGVGPGPTGPIGPGANTQNTNTNTTNNTNINNTTNTTNNANTNINISGSTISNSNIGSNNKVTQTTNVSNTNSVTIKQEVSVQVNGQPLQSDTPSFINGDDRTMVTLRAIAEALGAKVDWDPSTQTITITLGDKVVKLVVGQNTFTVNGENKTSDTAPGIVDGRTMVPARVVGEALGASVGYEPESKTVTVDKPIFKPLAPIHFQPIDQSNQGSQQGTPLPQTTPSSGQSTPSSGQTVDPTPAAETERQPLTDHVKSVVNGDANIFEVWLMESDATLYLASGKLDVTTRTWDTDPSLGFTGAVQVGVRDASGNLLWTSPVHYFGVDCLAAELIGKKSDRTDDWSETVPSDILSRAVVLEIKHGLNSQIESGNPLF